MAFWAWISGWLSLVFAVEAFGLLAHELNAALAIVFALLFVCVPTGAVSDQDAVEHETSTSFAPAWLAWVLLVAGFVMIPTTPALRPFALAAVFGAAHWWANSRGRVHPAAASLAVTALVFGVYDYLFTHSVQTWYLVNGWSHGVSEAVRAQVVALTDLSYSQFPLGPTYCGTHLLVLALAGVLGLLVTARHWLRAVPLAILGFANCVVVFVLYLAVFVYTMPDPLLPSRVEQMTIWQQVVQFVNPIYMPAVLALALAPIGGWLALLMPSSSRSGKAIGSMWVPVVAGGALAVVACGALMNLPGETRSGKGADGAIRAVLWKEGFMNWLTPTYERFGARSGGMFGNLPMTMRALGWEAEMIDTIDQAALEHADVLFMANQKDPLSDETREMIDKFVTGGGSLLLLGDHTWKKSDADRMILDDPIGTTNIEYNFDTAYYFIGGWLHSMQYFPHMATANLGDATNESGCVAGASLKVEYPAAPLVIGKHGYADHGVLENSNRGYMDNGKADPGEALGDLVLVAAQNVGQGRVVVVGDTSGFVNGIQVQTWGFTTRLMRWLASDGQALVSRSREFAAIGAFGVLVLLIMASARRAAVLPMLGLVALVVGWGSEALLRQASRMEPLTGNVAYVDLSHHGWHSLEAWRDDAISGVYMNLMRNDYLTLAAKHFDPEQLLASKLFVTVAPTQAYSPSEIETLKQFMNAGGTMLLSVGWEEKAGAQTLLDEFKIEIPDEPLGRVSDYIPGTQIAPQYWEAWPVRSQPKAEPLQTIASLWQGQYPGEYPVIVEKVIGAGKLVVIGDTKFLQCRNLEGEDTHNQANTQFMQWFITNILKADPA